MTFEWRNLGTLQPAGNGWLPFTQTEGRSELFRLTFDMPNRYWGKYNTPILLSFKYHGNSQPLPPSPPFRIVPEARGILLEIPFAKYASYLGCTSRIFEIKKASYDAINLKCQLEEMILNIPPPDDSNQVPQPTVQFQPGNLIYSWNASSGYGHKIDEIQFPLLIALTKVSSNLPARIRIYQSMQKALEDLNRPPHINPELDNERGIFLDAILAGGRTENQLSLSPIPLIINSQKSPIILEKLLPEAATINFRFDFVGG